MKKSALSKQDIERIESKFECIRRNSEYQNDYKQQQEYKKQHRNYEELEKQLYPKWFHFPLLNPATAIEDCKQKKNYPYWLEETLSGLVTSDILAPKPIQVESPEARKYLQWKKRRYKIVVKVKQGKAVKIPFPRGDRIYAQLDGEKLKRELKELKLTLDLEGFTKQEIKQQIGQLLKQLEPLMKRFLYKGTTSLRPTSIIDYLKTFDRKKRLSHKEMSNNENQQRKFKDHLRNARALINKGWWHYI